MAIVRFFFSLFFLFLRVSTFFSFLSYYEILISEVKVRAILGYQTPGSRSIKIIFSGLMIVFGEINLLWRRVDIFEKIYFTTKLKMIIYGKFHKSLVANSYNFLRCERQCDSAFSDCHGAVLDDSLYYIYLSFQMIVLICFCRLNSVLYLFIYVYILYLN